MTKGYGNNSPSSLITVTSQWPSWRLKSPALYCLCNRLSKLRSKETPKPALLPLCERNAPVTLTKGGFPSQRASNVENVSIWLRHNVVLLPRIGITDTIPYKLIEVSWHRCSMTGILSLVKLWPAFNAKRKFLPERRQMRLPEQTTVSSLVRYD